jgi:hypothetical protein
LAARHTIDRRRRIKTEIVAGNGTTVIVDHDCQPRPSKLTILAEQQNVQLSMIACQIAFALAASCL